MASTDDMLKNQFYQVVRYCEENEFDEMLRWLEDRAELPEERGTLFRIYSQNRKGSKFQSRKLKAENHVNAALTHHRLWPDLHITHVEKIA